MKTGTDIKELLLQRAPILMVDALADVSGDEAHTSFAVRPGNIFIREDGSMDEAGIIEHIAQSASAFAGYKAKLAGEKEAPLGFIGEVKNFRCYCLPKTGDILQTTIRMGEEVNGITLLSGETFINGELAAETQMKIYISKKE
ncbi:MAG: beta-hydroxyacyl-ACP dehydratase [Prevotella sp.]|nr:beta-hydroxyacyl-ACP dehydratase [Prevotella sp.]